MFTHLRPIIISYLIDELVQIIKTMNINILQLLYLAMSDIKTQDINIIYYILDFTNSYE